MFQKLHGKLLSVILCIAICCATLCGSIIAAQAASSIYDGTYTIDVGDEKQAVPFGANEVKVEVKFELDAGFAGGLFTANAQSNYSISDDLNDIKVVEVITNDNSKLTADQLAEKVHFNTRANADDNNNIDIAFYFDDILATSITIEYTILIDKDSQSNYVGNSTGAKYPVTISVDGDEFGVETTYAPVTFAASSDSDGWFHSHSSWCSIKSLVLDSEKNGKHTVVNTARCHLCTTTSGLNLPVGDNYISQVLPDYTEFDGPTTPVVTDEDIKNAIEDSSKDGKSPTSWIGISGVTVRYNDNGGLDVDVHVFSKWRADDNGKDKIELLICDEEGNELYRLPAVANGTSYFKNYGFPATEKMFTITGLSARDIDKNLLLTAVEYSGNVVDFSRTMNFCLADYCQNVVEEKSAIWVDEAESEQIEADKDVAAALYYYGKAIDESVFDKNTSAGGSSSNIEYTEVKYYEWDGTVADSLSDTTHSGETEEDAILIYNPSELAYLVMGAGGTTAKKYYKIAEANTVFNLNGMLNVSISSTSDYVQTATVNKNWITPVDGTNCFQGNFDGNGIIIYNLYSANSGSYGYAGLFGRTHTYPGTVIKNITVTASYLASFHHVGGIIGYAEQFNTKGLLTVDSCVVQNSYIGYAGSGTGNKRVGSIVGNGVYNALEITNCIARNNELESPDANNIGGFTAGAQNEWGGSATVSNSVAIGIAPYTTTTLSNTVLPTYKNVYTDQTVDASYTGITKGVPKAVDLGSVWFDTAEYPELSIFHKLAKTPVDENTHKEICVIKAGSASCSFMGLTEEHTFLKNAEGTLLVCECGYSKEIIGNSVVPNNKWTVKWDGTTSSSIADASVSAGTIDDPIEITTPSELAYLAKSVGSASDGLYYKVADDIAVFDFSGYTWAATSNATPFAGHFDGNGVIFKNINGQQGVATALFACVNASNTNKEVSFKNITITDSSFNMSASQWSNGAAAIVGWNSGGNYNNPGTITIKNCVVKNSTFTSNGTSGTSVATAGILCGNVQNAYINIDNCFSSGNTVTVPESVTSYGGLIGSASNFGVNISNTICLGMSPITNGSGRAYYLYRADAFSNVYTDQTVDTNVYVKEKLQQLSTANMIGKGAVAAMGLNSSVWFDTASYPELHVFHDMIEIYVDENTHKSVCQIFVNGTQQCATCGPTVEHTFTKNDQTKTMDCTCGYKKEIIGNTVTPNNVNYDEWDGTFSQPTTNIDGNIIINTAEELAWVALSSGTATAGNNYKVAANSIFNLMGMDGITMNSTAAQVKAAGDARIAAGQWNYTNAWRSVIQEKESENAFQGNFDGNGLIVYNMYTAKGRGYSGLFPYANPATANTPQVIKNVAVYASHIGGYHYAGGIVGLAECNTTSSIVNFEGCVVKNSFIYDNNDTNTLCNRTVGTIVGAMSHNGSTVNNCAAIDNQLSAQGVTGGLIGNKSESGGNITIQNSLSIGASVLSTSGAKEVSSKITNATLTNVYTADVAAATLGSAWFDTESYPELSVFHDMITIYIDANTHQNVCQHIINGAQCTTCGPVATHTMVDSDDGQYSECECGYGYEIKGIHAMDLPDSILNRITRQENKVYNEKFATNALFKTAYGEDVYGTQTIENEFDMYATSLNLKVNPHIAFTFAFNTPYKANRDKISVTFTVIENDGNTNTVIDTHTTDYVELSNGQLGVNWVNNSGAGRYHLYRFKQLPVSQLCEDIKVTVNYNGTPYDFGTYSAAGYAINAMNAGEDYMQHTNAAMALVYYSEMLAARAAV